MAIPDGTIDERVMRIMTTALREVGGPSQLIEHQEQNILPSLVEACYALVLRDEARLGNDEIARFLRISEGAVSSVFEAPMEAYVQRLRYRQNRDEEFQRHSDPEWTEEPLTLRQEQEYLAGALAKFGYDIVRRETVGGQAGPQS